MTQVMKEAEEDVKRGRINDLERPAKNWFFEKINKFYRPLTRIIKRGQESRLLISFPSIKNK